MDHGPCPWQWQSMCTNHKVICTWQHGSYRSRWNPEEMHVSGYGSHSVAAKLDEMMLTNLPMIVTVRSESNLTMVHNCLPLFGLKKANFNGVSEFNSSPWFSLLTFTACSWAPAHLQKIPKKQLNAVTVSPYDCFKSLRKSDCKTRNSSGFS